MHLFGQRYTFISYIWHNKKTTHMKSSAKTLMAFAAIILTTLSLTLSCKNTELKPLDKDGYMGFLYKYMPMPDSLMYPETFWEANVKQTLKTREEMAWGIPEREFRHFVLPLRVNNENLDDFRTVYADSLSQRVKGMSLQDAVLEINHWCHERVTYAPADARTSAPMATIATGKGRCGEESVLTVAALRAAGIPARQVYTPRWAHTDDNHAWVEAWVDGKWHFLGACEPEPVLDLGWFNAPVSRALLLHTKVSGNYRGDEDVIERNKIYTEINVIRGYVPSRRTVVTVRDSLGRPVEGARVEFKIYNYGELYTVSVQTSDRKGKAALDMGLGDMMIWAWKDGRFGFAKASSESETLVLSGKAGECWSADFDLIPPPENPLPNCATQEQIDENTRRMAEEDAIRMRMHSKPVNKEVIDTFIAQAQNDPQLKAEAAVILGSISPKDHRDVTLDVLEDALTGIRTLDPYVLNPRVELEKLLPYKAEIRAGLEGKLDSPEDVITWVKDSIRIVEDRNPQGLRTAPIAVWRNRCGDAAARNIFFVAVCRSLGFPARIDPATRKTQIRKDGSWLDIDFDGAEASESPKGTLKLISDVAPEYFKDFTITKIDNNGKGTLQFDDDYYEGTSSEMNLDKGLYLLTSGVRQADGSVLLHIEVLPVEADKLTELPLILRKQELKPLEILGKLRDTSFCTGDWCILFLTKKFDEPTNHATKLLEGMSNVITVGPDDTGYKALAEMVQSCCKADPKYLPYVLLCDKEGNVYYFSQGYNTSLKANLEEIILKMEFIK